MRKRLPTHLSNLYHDHKWNCKVRNIEFSFTLDEWIKWWELHLGPDWVSLRGRRKGQYVMARIGDVGSYAPGNVKCVLCEDNHSEMKDNGGSLPGEMNPNAKLTEKIVRSIYFADGTLEEVAKRFGTSIMTVSQIRHRQTWKSFLDTLPERQHVDHRYLNP
jgi:hypothetical protein